MDNIGKSSAPTAKINDHIEQARAYCIETAHEYWKAIQERSGASWRMRDYSIPSITLSKEDKVKAAEFAGHLLKLNPDYAGYQLSIQYMNLLPKKYREKQGIYYTPINVVEAMIQDSKQHNIDLKIANIIDKKLKNIPKIVKNLIGTFECFIMPSIAIS